MNLLLFDTHYRRVRYYSRELEGREITTERCNWVMRHKRVIVFRHRPSDFVSRQFLADPPKVAHELRLYVTSYVPSRGSEGSHHSTLLTQNCVSSDMCCVFVRYLIWFSNVLPIKELVSGERWSRNNKNCKRIMHVRIWKGEKAAEQLTNSF